MVVGAFGPWVTALSESVTGVDGSSDGWFVIGAAVLGAILLLTYRGQPTRAKAIWILIFAVIATAVTFYDRHHASNAISNNSNELVRALAHIGWGLTLAMVASISLGVAALSLLGKGPLADVDGAAEAPKTHRECPHCKEPMRRDASVCPHCQRDSERWRLNDGVWWVKVGGVWNWYDDSTGHWKRATPMTTQAPPATDPA
jgi:hypothetical protein